MYHMVRIKAAAVLVAVRAASTARQQQHEQQRERWRWRQHQQQPYLRHPATSSFGHCSLIGSLKEKISATYSIE
jgi:hypothetical protein